MKHARGFFLALAILIMPNAAYYVFNWILVLKRQINEENFLRLPLYVDYIPEAIILVAMCLEDLPQDEYPAHHLPARYARISNR